MDDSTFLALVFVPLVVFVIVAPLWHLMTSEDKSLEKLFIDAFHNGDLAEMKRLITLDRNLLYHTVDESGYSAFSYALLKHDDQMIQLLLRFFEMDDATKGLFSTDSLKQISQEKKDKMLCEIYCDPGILKLHFSTSSCDLINNCLESKANINTQDENGNSILHLLISKYLFDSYLDKAKNVWNKTKKVFQEQMNKKQDEQPNFLRDDAQKILAVLQTDGFDFNLQNKQGETPLILACKLNPILTLSQIVFIKHFLELSPNLNVFDKQQKSAVMYLIEKANNCSFEDATNIVALLQRCIKQGADMEKQNDLGVSATLMIQMSPNPNLREVLQNTK